MAIGCNIWMICLKLNWYFYGQSRMFQLPQFVWTPCYSVWDVFNNFLLIYATDRSKNSSDQKRFFIALSLYPISFFANTPFKLWYWQKHFCIYLQIYLQRFLQGLSLQSNIEVSVLSGDKDTGLYGCRDTGGNRDTRIQGYNNTGI